jgi:hypothetical protein
MLTLSELVIGLHLATAHFGPNTLESNTPGIYARVNSGPAAGLTVGTFRNSYSRQSSYIAWSFQTSDERFALTVGAVTGYSAARVMPLVVPSVRVPLGGDFAARFSYIPKPVKQGHNAGLHLSVERQF